MCEPLLNWYRCSVKTNNTKYNGGAGSFDVLLDFFTVDIKRFDLHITAFSNRSEQQFERFYVNFEAASKLRLGHL